MIPSAFYPYIGAALAAIALFGLGYWKGYSGEHESFVEYQAKVLAAQKQAEADAALRLQRAEEVSKDVVAGWNTAVDYLHAHPAVRVLPARCGDGQASTLSATTQGLKFPSAQSGLDTSVTIAADQCEERLNWAVEDAVQVIMLQRWIEEQHKASK